MYLLKCSKPCCVYQVQADGYMLEEELQKQQGALEDRLQELERRGEELEKKIHNCTPGQIHAAPFRNPLTF